MNNPSGVIIYMRSVPGEPLMRALTAPLLCLNMNGTIGEVPRDFKWDGSSVPRIFQGIFPRHNHPIASCRHDFRCRNARNAAERKWADEQFREDVGRTSWWITKQIGYIGVRIGATFGAGVNY
jgi:hypothetical protein